MRIELQNPYAAALNDSQKAGSKATDGNLQEPVSADLSASVQLSGLSQQAMAAPEIRQDRVSQLQQAIASGTYSVSNEALASAMMRDLAQE